MHDPYGGIQQTLVSTYDPQLKFSGKERDAESGLDYFGARYYDRNIYRFISTDFSMNSVDALNAPHRWNLYSYCRNSPVTFVDMTGGHEVICYVLLSEIIYNHVVTEQNSQARGATSPPTVQVFPMTEANGKQHLVFALTFEVKIGERGHLNYSGLDSYEDTFRHEMQHVTDMSLMLNFKYRRIERAFLKDHNLDNAQKKADEATRWAAKWSKRLWDSPWNPFPSLMAQFFSCGDPFWGWVNFWPIIGMQLMIINAAK